MTTHTLSKITKLLLGLSIVVSFFVGPIQTNAACNAWNDLKTPNGETFDPLGGHSFMVTTGSSASITVKNFATAASGCTYSIHIASYKVFDTWGTPAYLSSQTLYADSANSIAPGETKTISVGHPSTCAYQVDFFEGPAAPATNPDFANLPQYKLFDWGGVLSPLCGARLTLTKTVVNDNGGTKHVSDFPLFVSGTSMVSGVSHTFTPGTYTASETQAAGYTASSWGGDCSANGTVTLADGQSKTCTITNNDNQPFTCSASPNPQEEDVQWVDFTAVGGQFTPNYDWQFPGAEGQYTQGVGNPGRTYYTTPGTYTATVHNYPTGGNWNSPGALTASCTVVITPANKINLQGKPTTETWLAYPFLEGPVTITATNTVDLRWTPSGSLTSCTASASPANASWSGSKSVSGGTTNTIVVPTNTTFSITCQKAGGGTTSDNIVVNVSATPPPPTTLACTPTPTTATLNTDKVFTATGGSGTYAWSGGEIPATGGNTSTFTTKWTTAGPKSVVVTRGTESATCAVTVQQAPSGITCTPDTQTVGVETTVLQPITASGGGGYTWNTGSGGSVCAPGPTCAPKYTTAGTKIVSLTGVLPTSSGTNTTDTCEVVVKGSVTVKSNQPTTWTITSKGTILQQTDPSSGKSYANQVPGVYNISGVPALAGFTGPTIEPVTASQSIPNTGADIEFRITYTPIEPPTDDDDDDTSKYLDLKVSEVNGQYGDTPVKVLYGKKAWLQWKTNNIVKDSCVASGGWTGAKAEDGTEQSKSITSAKMETFTITCMRAGGGDSRGIPVSDSVQIGTRPPQCSDGIDNDDGDKPLPLIDEKDPGCWSLPDGTYNRYDDNEVDGQPLQCDVPPKDPGCPADDIKPATQCNNGLDDDGDGKVDYKDVTPSDKKPDPGCSSIDDPSELDDPNIIEI